LFQLTASFFESSGFAHVRAAASSRMTRSCRSTGAWTACVDGRRRSLPARTFRPSAVQAV